jgi:rRNA maturation RNase YbeY
MIKAKILFHNADNTYRLRDKRKKASILINHSIDHGFAIDYINYVFCSDEYLLDMNRRYLAHNYYTDILSFQSSKEPMAGDIYISIDRVRDNAKELGIKFSEELLRVISHGLLHFMGFTDKTPSGQSEMRTQEDILIAKLMSGSGK